MASTALSAQATFREAIRFDARYWRRAAEMGAIHLPDPCKRVLSPLVSACIYAMARRHARAVRRNQRRLLGRRSWLREHWDAYRVFVEFARTFAESLEPWERVAERITVDVRNPTLFTDALAAGRGLVVVTAHFGSWEVGARALRALGRPVNMVTAHDPNPTARHFTHLHRTRHGFRVIYADGSPLGGLEILRALQRHEIVGMHIDPWGPMAGTHAVEFGGLAARFQIGPFAIGRIARAPVVPVFSMRRTADRHQLVIPDCFDIGSRAAAEAALRATVGTYERLVRAHPEQWFVFEELWPGQA